MSQVAQGPLRADDMLVNRSEQGLDAGPVMLKPGHVPAQVGAPDLDRVAKVHCAKRHERLEIESVEATGGADRYISRFSHQASSPLGAAGDLPVIRAHCA